MVMSFYSDPIYTNEINRVKKQKFDGTQFYRAGRTTTFKMHKIFNDFFQYMLHEIFLEFANTTQLSLLLQILCAKKTNCTMKNDLIFFRKIYIRLR